MVLENLKQGNKLQIFFELNHTFYYTSFIEAVYENKLLIYTPIEEGRLISLPMDKAYFVKVFNEMGIFVFHNVRITKSFDKDTYHFLLLENFKYEKQAQRREHYRLDCMVPFLIKDKNDDTYQAIIKDISEGGMLFVSNLELIVAEERECIVSFNNTRISMLIKVLDRHGHTKPGCKYEYRSKLMFMADEDRAILMAFIFEAQRNFIRRSQNMALK